MTGIRIYRKKISTLKEKLTKHVSALSKNFFCKANLCYLYKVVELKDGTLYPVYTAKPRSDAISHANSRDHKFKFPIVANYKYINWWFNLRKDLNKFSTTRE